LIIAAANSTSLRMKMVLGERAEALCTRAAAHLYNTSELASKNGSARAVMEWAGSSDEQPRIAYLSAMSFCLQSTTANNDLKLQASLRTIQSIPEYYLALFPPAADVVLKGCVVPLHPSEIVARP
jgi:hypothetical protein